MTEPNNAAASPASSVSPKVDRDTKITIISHSSLFYWWPVWALGFIMAFITYIQDHRLVILPPNAKIILKEGEEKKFQIDLPDSEYANRHIKLDSIQTGEGEYQARPRISYKPAMGAIFAIVLILVITITNVPLRGLWSVIVIFSIIMIALIITVFNKWESLFRALGHLHIYSNMAFYLFIAIPLFIIWLIALLVFDPRRYMIFTPGQVKVCEEVGDRERSFDTVGMTVEKHRDDLFRHLFLGFGSGDITVRTSGAERVEIEMPNVLRVSKKLEAIQQMLREKPVV